MQRIIISGCCGHMGRVVADICANDSDVEAVAGIDLLAQPMDGFPVFSTPTACGVEADAVIDFSHPAALSGLLDFCVQRRLPIVLATTGYSEEQLTQIDGAAKYIPVFRSANMSLGINVLMDLVHRAASLLGEDFDVEIEERHHRRKLDAPSGTALMLAGAAASALPYDPEYIYDRHSVRRPGTSGRSVSPPCGGHHCGRAHCSVRRTGRGDRTEPPRRQPGGLRRGRGESGQIPGRCGCAGAIRHVAPHQSVGGADTWISGNSYI